MPAKTSLPAFKRNTLHEGRRIPNSSVFVSSGSIEEREKSIYPFPRISTFSSEFYFTLHNQSYFFVILTLFAIKPIIIIVIVVRHFKSKGMIQRAKVAIMPFN